jgi:hypothetical protein
MASNVISNTIDESFPVAGVDNDSQGFRDNFTIIKDSLAAAKAELEDLQEKAIVKSALTDSTVETLNNMAGTAIVSVKLDQYVESFTAVGQVPNNQNLSFTNGHYQTITAAGDITLTLADWPATDGCARITVEIDNNLNDGTVRTITFKGELSAAMKKVTSEGWTSHSATELTITTVSDANPTIVEFWSTDGGSTIFARYLGIFQ